MKKLHFFKKNFMILLCAATMMTGCASVVELTNEEEDLIAEYAAGTMISAYEEYMHRFDIPVSAPGSQTPTEPAVTPQTPTQGTETETPAVVPETSAPVVEDSAQSLVESLEITGVEITELGYFMADKYPEEAFAFTVEAPAGKQLLVVEYDAWNSVDAQSTMTVNAEDAIIRAVINGEKKVTVFKTLLRNDIMNMNEKVFEPGQAETAVLIFLVDDEMAADISSVEVVVTK